MRPLNTSLIFEVTVWYTIDSKFSVYHTPVNPVYFFPFAGYLNVQGITTHVPDKPTTDVGTSALHSSALAGDTETRNIQ